MVMHAQYSLKVIIVVTKILATILTIHGYSYIAYMKPELVAM